jgi:hypothetical protein
MSGKGVFTTADGTRFDADWANDESVGNGIATKKDGSKFSATFKSGKLNLEDQPLAHQ